MCALQVIAENNDLKMKTLIDHYISSFGSNHNLIIDAIDTILDDKSKLDVYLSITQSNQLDVYVKEQNFHVVNFLMNTISKNNSDYNIITKCLHCLLCWFQFYIPFRYEIIFILIIIFN